MIIARRILFWAALVGLFASVYLLIAYTANTPIVCGSGQGCDIVRASEWAYVWGVIPRPLLGALFYGFMLLLVIARTLMSEKWPLWAYRLTFAAATIGVVESVWLVWIQYAYIEAFCNWCLVSAAAATVIFAAVFGDRPTALTRAQSLQELRWQFISMIVAFIAGVVGLWWLL